MSATIPQNIRSLATIITQNMGDVEAAGGDVKLNEATAAALLPENLTEATVKQVTEFLADTSAALELALGEASVPKIDKDNAQWNTSTKLNIGGAQLSASFKARGMVSQGVKDGQAQPQKQVNGISRSSCRISSTKGHDEVREHLHGMADAFFK